MILEIAFNDEIISKATQRDNELKDLNNSITKGRGRKAGFVAEEAFGYNFPGFKPTKGSLVYNQDFLLDNERYELKTKRSSFMPQLDWEQSVSEFSTHQKPDFYVFMHIKFNRHDDSKGYREYFGVEKVLIDGYLPYEEFWEKAYVVKTGQKSGVKDYVSRATQHNILIKDLKEF
jgi:hypothetical protein